MKTFFKLCCSIGRRNRGFTAGIFILSTLSVAIAFLGANFGASGSDTIMGFLADSGTPDAVYATEPLPDGTRGLLEEIPGVACVSPGFVWDTSMEIWDGSPYSVRLFLRDQGAPFVQTVHEKSDYGGADPAVAVSFAFAARHGIHAGDSVTVDTPLGKKRAFVNAIVSSPETLSCVRDEMSAYEDGQFAYLYADNRDFEKPAPLRGLSNQWLVRFEDSLNADGQKKCMDRIRASLDGHLVSESFIEESDAMNSIRDDLRTINVLCRFIPGVIWLIGLGFNFIFIRIITENQRRTIGMLRALGFSVVRVTSIFIVYTVLVNLPALLCGVFLGGRLLRVCLGLIAAAKGILDVTVTILPGTTAVMLLTVFVIGIAAALMGAGTIAKIDPCEAYGGKQNTAPEPPEWIRGIRTDAFLKIAIVSFVRNRKRQIIGAFCVAACVVSMCVGFEGVLTIGYPVDAVFGGRYRYDLAVRGIDESVAARIESEVRGVSLAERETCFSAELFGKTVRVATAKESDEMTILTDASGNRIFPGNGVILDEMCAKINRVSIGDSVEIDGHALPVTGIAREILYMVLYVSPQTAAEMGYGNPNCVLLRLDEDARIGDVKRQIAGISGQAYAAELASQKESARDGFKAMQTVMLFFAVFAFCVGSLLILNFATIDFQENRYRYATLRALGASVRRLGGIAVFQNLFRVIPGVAIACPLCYGCVSVLLRLLSGASQQYVMVRFAECLLAASLISLLYILLGTGIALYQIRKMDFCGVMNERE